MENNTENQNNNVVTEKTNENVTANQQPIDKGEAKEVNNAQPQTSPNETPAPKVTPSINEQTPVTENPSQPKPSTPAPSDAQTSPTTNQEPPVAKNPVNNFNSEEKIIYNIKPEKDANPIGVILFFVVMISFVFFLPKASDYLSKYINIGKKPTTPVVNKEPKEEEKTEKKEDKYYDLNTTINDAKIGDLLMSNFVKINENNTYQLTFTLINNSESLYDFSKKYYFDFYDEKSYLSSSLIYSYDPLPGKESREFSVNLPAKTYERATKFALVERKTADYPEVELTNQEEDYKLLKCNYNNEEIIYYFKDNYLEKIDSTYKENINNANYDNSLSSYRTLADKYNNINGIESNIIENPNTGFTLKTSLNLKDIVTADLTNLKEYKYFIYHEKSKVVSYEITSLGYTCS